MLLFKQNHNMRPNQTTSPPQFQSDVHIQHNMNMAAIPLTVIGYVLFPHVYHLMKTWLKSAEFEDTKL